MSISAAVMILLALYPATYLYVRLTRSGTVNITNPWLLVPLTFAVAYGVGYLAAHDRIDDEPGIALVVAAAIVLGWLGLLFGFVIGSRVPLARWLKSGGKRIPPRWLSFGLIAIGVAGSIVYFWRIGGIPLLMADVEQARVDAAEAGGGVLRTLATLLLPGAWLAICRAAATGEGRYFAGIALIIAIISQLLTGNRSLAIVALIVAILVVMFVRGWHRVTVLQAGALGLFVLALVLTAGALGAYRYARSPEVWATDAQIAAAVERGDWITLGMQAIRGYLIVPSNNLRLTMAAVPDVLPYQLGHTWVQPLLTALPGHQTTFDADLKAALDQDYPGGGTVPGLVGEGWANFSWLGVFGWPLLVALALTVLFRIVRSRRDPALWALYAYALAHVSGGLVGGLFVASVFPFVAYASLAVAFALGVQRPSSH